MSIKYYALTKSQDKLLLKSLKTTQIITLMSDLASTCHNTQRYTKFDVLILDDFGLKTLTAEQSADLYDLIVTTNINSSLIITTNRKIEKWMELFYDPVMANAALDRIVNNAYRIVLEGEPIEKNLRQNLTWRMTK